MSIRLQVVLSAAELREIQRAARRDRLTVSEWDIDHPRLPAALTAAAGAAWKGGRLPHAIELATRGVAVAGPDHPAGAGPQMQLANVAMFEGRTDDALDGYRATAALLRVAGAELGLLMCDLCVAQVLAYADRDEEARTLMPELLRRATDHTELDEVYLEEQEAAFGLPPLVTDSAGVPMVDEQEPPLAASNGGPTSGPDVESKPAGSM